MTFQPGNSGNPGGRRGEKIFADALRIALNEDIEDQGKTKKKARAIADKLVSEALKGEAWAIQQVMDRMDGKPAQAIIGGDEDDPPIRFTRILREVVEPPKREEKPSGSDD